MRVTLQPTWRIILFLLILELIFGGRLATLLSSPIQTLTTLACLLIALTIHEFAHALAADRLGDPNPRLQGRLSLNPLHHLDPVGTLLIITTGFGWGKPVEFDAYNLRRPITDGALIAAAGPASNFILAALIAIFLRFGLQFIPTSSYTLPLMLFLVQLFSVNLSLGIFNLVPLYPLDGHHILRALLPSSEARHRYDAFNRHFGLIVSLLLILPIFGGKSIISQLTTPTFQAFTHFLLGI